VRGIGGRRRRRGGAEDEVRPVHVLGREEFVGIPGLMAQGFGIGMASAVGTYIGASCCIEPMRHVEAVVGGGLGIVLCVVIGLVLIGGPLVGFPIWLLWRRRRTIGTMGRTFFSGLGFGAGLGFLSSLIMTREPGNGPEIIVVGTLVCGGIAGGIGLAVGVLTFGTGENIRIQDGTVCPGCGYSLIGNESMVCPECGRRFTFEELGTTEEEFRGKHEAA
jgi:hypothetical protein